MGDPSPGKIFTFYSYKGGTGRSMALANFACWLSREGMSSAQRTLIIDWDLEAPGLHKYFPESDSRESALLPGLIDYFERIRARFASEPKLYQRLCEGEGADILRRDFPLDEYLIREVVPGVDLLKAGRLDSSYARAVSAFDWVAFHDKYCATFRALREWLSSDYSACLIDSRTGFNDVSGICTMLMPEKLVLVFTPNRQNLSGVIDLAARAINYRRAADDFRPLSIFPVPSRIENAEQDLKQKWRRQYQQEFEAAFKNLYQLDDCDLAKYFDEVLLPHVSFYAYGEEVALRREKHSDALSLSRAYDTFFRILGRMEFAWDQADEEDKETSFLRSAPELDDANGDIFISYAHIDNEPLFSETRGWVDVFHSALDVRLQQRTGRKLKIWRDSKIETGDHYKETAIHQIRNSAVFILILSPQYARSEACLRELQEFVDNAAGQGNRLSHLVKVVKTPVEEASLPGELSRLLDYRFYETDPSNGRIREFGLYGSGSKGEEKFLRALDDLAGDISRVLRNDDIHWERETPSEDSFEPPFATETFTNSKDLLPRFEMTSTLKVTMLGDSGSGKTVYLSSMYARLREGVKGLALRARDDATDLELGDNMEKLFGQNRWPPGTSSAQKNYDFDLLVYGRVASKIDWVDYRGGALLEETDSKAGRALARRLQESHAILWMVDMSGLASERIDGMRQRIQTRVARMAAMCRQVAQETEQPRAWIFVRTKSDMVQAPDGNPDWNRAVMELIQHLGPTIEVATSRNSSYAAALPVSSVGRVSTDGSLLGDDPSFVEWPLLLSWAFLAQAELRHLGNGNEEQPEGPISGQAHALASLVIGQLLLDCPSVVRLLHVEPLSS